MHCYGFIISLILIFAMHILDAQKLPVPADTASIPLDPQVRYGRLSNGFTYYILKCDDPEKFIEMHLIVNAGRLHEDSDQTDLAHFVEHMAFRGTKHFPKDSLNRYFEPMGMTMGGNFNASTGASTNYWLKIPKGNPLLFTNGLTILRDWAQDMTFDSVEIEHERGVLIGEMRKGDHRHLQNAEIEAQLLKRPEYQVARQTDVAECTMNCTRETLVRFYKDWYRPDLQAAIIVGDVDVEQTEQEIIDTFRDLRTPANPRKIEARHHRFRVRLDGDNNYILQTRKKFAATRLTIYQKKGGVLPYRRTSSDFRQSVMDRLFNEMVRNRIETQIASTDHQFNRFSQSLVRNAINALANVDALVTTIEVGENQAFAPLLKYALMEIERIRRHGFLDSELTKARESISQEYNRANKPALHEVALRLRLHFIYGAAAPDLTYERQILNTFLKEITLEELNAFAASWIDIKTNRDIVVIRDEETRSSMPDHTSMLKWMDSIRNTPVGKISVISADVDPLKDFEISAGDKTATVIEKVVNAETGVTDLVLSNGIKILIRPYKDPDYAPVTVHGVRRGGADAYKGAGYYAALFAGNALAFSGMGKLSGRQLKKYLFDKKIAFSAGLGVNSASIHASGRPESLEAMLKLVYLLSTAPVRMDQGIYDQWLLAEAKAISEYGLSSIDSAMESLGDRKNFDESAFTLQNLQKTQQQLIKKILDKEFRNLADYTFVITGDFDYKTIEPMLIRYIGALPASARKRESVRRQSVDITHQPPNRVPVQMVFHGGTTVRPDVRLSISGSYRTEKDKILLQYLRHALQWKLFDRLRKKEGATYSVSVQLKLSHQTRGYRFQIRFLCEKASIDKLISAAREELLKLEEHGFDEPSFESAKALTLGSHQHDLRRNKFWSDHLRQSILLERDPAEILKTESIINLTTREELNDAARKYLKTNNMSTFILYPESSF